MLFSVWRFLAAAADKPEITLANKAIIFVLLISLWYYDFLK